MRSEFRNRGALWREGKEKREREGGVPGGGRGVVGRSWWEDELCHWILNDCSMVTIASCVPGKGVAEDMHVRKEM